MMYRLKINNLLVVVSLLVLTNTLFSQEICNNDIDDDGDGLVDCLDPDCLDSPDCPAFDFPGACLPIGYYPDITGTEGGYKPGGSTADVSIPIPASTNRASLIIQGVYQQATVDAETGVNDLNHAQERIVWGRVEFDLDNSTSSGWVEYAVNNHESKRFSWVDESMGPDPTNTYDRVGHDFSELTSYEFTFNSTGTSLTIGCSEADIDISYYAIFYGNFDSQSMTSIPGADPTQYPVYYDAGTLPANLTATVDMLTGDDRPDYIQIRAIGINQNRYGNGGVPVQDTREEAMSIKYILIDLNTLKASGNLTVNNGNIPDMNSTFTFSDYDVTSGLSITADATLLGDSDGNILPPNQIAVCDMTLEVVGDQLIMTRSDEHGADFNEIYYVEFLRYSDQPYSSSFYLTQNAYSSPTDIGFDTGLSNDGTSVDGYVDFEIPQGAKRGYLEIRANGLWSPFSLGAFVGPAPSNTTRTNGNQMYAFTEVNFDLDETTGYFVTITTSTQQQLYAWQEVPINPAIDITTLDIYGQLPNSDERLNFEIIEPNIFRVHLENDKIAYERILNMTFLGSKVNLVYSTFTQNDALTTGCDSVHMQMEICNSGGTDLTIPVPVSFYTSDPTTDPTAIYLQTEMYDLDIEQGQCETFDFAIDISTLDGALSGDITIVLNDDGSFAGVPGETIPATFDPLDLGNQDSPVLECEYEYNIITSSYEIELPPEPTITFNQDLFVICPSDEADIVAEVTGTFGDVALNWVPTGETDLDITVSPATTTWYYLSATDECHTVTDSVKVEIGTVDISAITIVDAEVCPGQPGLLGSLTILPDDPDFTYTVSGGGDVFGPTTDNLFPDLAGGVYYLVNIVDERGCFLDTTVYVGLGDNEVTANFVSDSIRDVSCFGALDGGAYVKDIEGGILPPFQVIWSTLAGAYSTVPGIPEGGANDIDNLFGGMWTVTVVDEEGCAWSHAFEIFEPELLVLNPEFNHPTCYQFSDGSITITTTGGNGDEVYEIRDADGNLVNEGGSNTANSLGQGTYTLLVTDAKGCTATGVVDLVHPPELDLVLELTDPLCNGFETGLAVVTDVINYTGAYENVSYYWTPNPTGEDGLGEDSLINIGAGSYVITINDENGCSKIVDFTITEPSPIELTVTTEAALCRTAGYQSGNGVVTVSAIGGTGNFNYQWDYPQDETFSINSTWGGRNPGEYTITVIDIPNGCIKTETVVLDSINPIANFTLSSAEFTAEWEGTAPVSVHFENVSENYINEGDPGAEANFFWTLNRTDGIPWFQTDDYEKEFDTTYTVGGIYETCLAVFNKNNCVDTLCIPIKIFDPLLFVPVNIFTPDGDNINDVFSFDFRSQAVAEFNCLIVNRWGTTIFEMTDVTQGWDGTDKTGNACKDGVYFYTYSGKADNGEPFFGQGNVQLIRGN